MKDFIKDMCGVLLFVLVLVVLMVFSVVPNYYHIVQGQTDHKFYIAHKLGLFEDDVVSSPKETYEEAYHSLTTVWDPQPGKSQKLKPYTPPPALEK